jgi:hypothetical protein
MQTTGREVRIRDLGRRGSRRTRKAGSSPGFSCETCRTGESPVDYEDQKPNLKITCEICLCLTIAPIGALPLP